MDALRFSLASDIVELVVLTSDELFLQTLREAVGAARRLWHVPSPDKVSDLLVAGGVGILVLDVQSLHDTGTLFITQIKRQFPDLVVVAAGNREHENALAPLISDGTIYRFIHKPMSPARARLFAEAAVKRYGEQKKRVSPAAAVVPPPRNGALWFGGTCAVICVLLAAIWGLRRGSHDAGEPAAEMEASAPALTGAPAPSPADAVLLARAAQALDSNRLTTPAGDNALELYSRALARDPSDKDARAGIAEVHERLLARAENALLEERLDEASAAIEAARKAGVESGRIAFLTTQLAKAREQIKTALELGKLKSNAAQAPESAAGGEAAPSAALAMERIKAGHLIEPERDSARYHVQEALRADPTSEAAQQAEQALALALFSAVRGAIDRRDFARASSLLDAAAGVAAPANIENLRRSLAAARHEADTEAANQLLKFAEQRIAEDRLIEPQNDSAQYYVNTLRAVDPANTGLEKATQELGARLISKGKIATTLQQYDAARSWLEQATAIGYSSPEMSAALRDLDAALARQKFSANVVSANQLELLKSVQPVYPKKAEITATEGWVELDFTVSERGEVKDVSVHAANPAGVFDQAAVGALLKWRYKPVMRDATAVPQRARIRIRFTLAQG